MVQERGSFGNNARDGVGCGCEVEGVAVCVPRGTACGLCHGPRGPLLPARAMSEAQLAAPEAAMLLGNEAGKDELRPTSVPTGIRSE